MPDREYRSPDKRFAVSLPEAELERMLGFCKKEKGKETGGVLVGSYSASHDCALVKTVSKAPKDSKAGHTWFSQPSQPRLERSNCDYRSQPGK